MDILPLCSFAFAFILCFSCLAILELTQAVSVCTLKKFRVDVLLCLFRKKRPNYQSHSPLTSPFCTLFSHLASLLLLTSMSTFKTEDRIYSFRLVTKNRAGMMSGRKSVRSCVHEWAHVWSESVARLVIQLETEAVPLISHQQQHSQEDHGYSKWNWDDHQSAEFVKWLLHCCKQTHTWRCWEFCIHKMGDCVFRLPDNNRSTSDGGVKMSPAFG